MGRGPANVRQGDVKAAVKAVVDAGCDVERVEVDRNGTIIVLTRNPIVNGSRHVDPNGSDWDAVLPHATR
jgi:hypothetical protein